RSADPGAAPGGLFGQNAAIENAEAEPAVLRRDVRVQEPELPRLPDDVARKLPGLIVMRRPRPDLVERGIVRQIAQRSLLVGQREIDHDDDSPMRSRTARS